MRNPHRSNRVILAAFLALSTLGIIGCGSNHESTSDVKHNVGEPTRGAHEAMWIAIDDSQYLNMLLPFAGMSQPSVLPAHHPLTKRLQYWVDRIDVTIREKSPDSLAFVPKPKARVLEENEGNAFVTGVPVCYDLPLDVISESPPRGDTADAMYLDLASGGLEIWPQGLSCIKGGSRPEALAALLAQFNATSSGCQYNFENGRLRPNDACVAKSELGSYRHARQVVIIQTANYITVNSGLIPEMTEEELVGVLTHELGHYYRSHLNVPSSEYDFFYTLGRRNPAHKPIPEPELQNLGNNAALASSFLIGSDRFATVAGQKLRSELYLAAGSLVRTVCDTGDCSEACGKAQEVLQDPSFATKAGMFPLAAADMSTAYTHFETYALACLETVHLVSGNQVTTANSLSWDSVRYAVLEPSWPQWLGHLTSDGSDALRQLNTMTAARLGDLPPPERSVGAALIAASQSLSQQDEQFSSILRQASEQHLGYYTAEQEADELALEWLSDTGLSPKYAVDAMRALNRKSETSLRGNILGEADCESLYARGWKDHTGADYFVPLGDYAESHHSMCYRMFNMDREIEAHGFVAANRPKPTPPGPAWTQLQTEAAQLRGSLGEVRGLALNRWLAKTYLAGCPFATHE